MILRLLALAAIASLARTAAPCSAAPADEVLSGQQEPGGPSIESLLGGKAGPSATPPPPGPSNIVFYAAFDGSAHAWRIDAKEVVSSMGREGNFVAGPAGQAVVLDRSVSYHACDGFPAGEGTVMFWLGMRRAVADLSTDVFSMHSGLEGRYFCNLVAIGLADGKLTFRTTGASGVGAKATADVSAWPPGQWRHVAASWDRRALRLFVNGKQAAETTRAADGPLSACVPAKRARALTLAGDSQGSCAADDLRLYARALSPAEIAELAAKARPAVAADVLAADVFSMGSDCGLLLDSRLVEGLSGAQLRMHAPKPAGVALTTDRPWEGPCSQALHVFQHGDRFLLYYRCARHPRGAAVVCCAQSADGVTWTKPDLELVDQGGSRHNNVVADEHGRPFDNLVVFKDESPAAAGRNTIGALTFRANQADGTSPTDKLLIPLKSSDSFRFHGRGNPVMPPTVARVRADGDFHSVFWSAAEQAYVGFFGTWNDAYRTIRASSRYGDAWGRAERMESDVLGEQILSAGVLPYPRAPRLYIALAGCLDLGRSVLTDSQAKALGLLEYGPPFPHEDTAQTELLLTWAGGKRFYRPMAEAFMGPGTDPRNAVSRANIAAQGLLQTGPRELSLYVTRAYGQAACCIERLTLRLDGFGSAYAPPAGGEALTRPLRFTGQTLEVNFATGAAGNLRVELQDAKGSPIPGFALADCEELKGDEVARVVAWKGARDVGPLAGRPMRLRFAWKDADLYSFRFRPTLE